MSSYLLACIDGDVTIAADGGPLCSGSWAMSPAATPFVVDQAAIEACGVAFAAGFSIVTTVWLMSLGFRFVLSLLK